MTRPNLFRGALAAATVLALATGATTAALAASGPTTPQDKALFAYAACMRSKGVQIPDPVKGSDGRYAFPQISPTITQAAGVRDKAVACAKANNLPTSNDRQGGFQQSPQMQAAFAKFRACLKQHGVTQVPFGPGGRPPQGQNGRPPAPGQDGRPRFQRDPKTQAAFEACRSLMPFGRFGDGGPGGFGGGPDDNGPVQQGTTPLVPKSTTTSK